jgi:phage baseplate assembly protein W
MATYIGFSTQHVGQVRRPIDLGVEGAPSLNSSSKSKNKFRTVDEEIVIQDLINSFNITQGEKPGKPDYGTTLWSFVFEPNTFDVQNELRKEVIRIASLDPRLSVTDVQVSHYDSGIQLQLEMYILPFNNPMTLSILLDQTTKRAVGS